MGVIVQGVSKKWSNSRTKNHRGKKYWHAYIYDEDGHFRRKRISSSQVLLWKAKVKKIGKYYCKHCEIVFLAVRSRRIPQCPRCKR